MVILPERPHMYFDVDYTLVRPWWPDEASPENSCLTFASRSWELNRNIVEEIKIAKARGQVTVVWSQGGAAWAATVVENAGLEEYVDCCMAKPSWFFDDKSYDTILDATRLCFREF